jgi:hypothetical protein
MAGGKEHPAVATHEIAAGRLTDPVRDSADPGAIDVHDVLLVASPAVSSALENQPAAVVAEVGFRVLTAIGELPDIPKMAFTGLCLHRLGLGLRRGNPTPKPGDQNDSLYSQTPSPKDFTSP